MLIRLDRAGLVMTLPRCCERFAAHGSLLRRAGRRSWADLQPLTRINTCYLLDGTFAFQITRGGGENSWIKEIALKKTDHLHVHPEPFPGLLG